VSFDIQSYRLGKRSAEKLVKTIEDIAVLAIMSAGSLLPGRPPTLSGALRRGIASA